jgi:hypothetical protein
MQREQENLKGTAGADDVQKTLEYTAEILEAAFCIHFCFLTALL